MDIVSLSQILDVLKRIGTNLDPSGTSTLFAKLKQISDNGDSIKNIIGTANPSTAGTDTLFKYLKQVNDYVDTLEASLGQVNDPMNINGSVHAKIKEARDLLGWINSNIGDNSNAPHPDGSVYAKLKDIKNAIIASTDWSKQKPRGIAINSSVPATGSKDIINITGKGYFLSFYIYANIYYAHPGIIIDGAQILPEVEGYTSASLSTMLNGPLRFNNSLRIYIHQPGSGQGNTFYTTVSYSLD